jgi:hypothetical protein
MLSLTALLILERSQQEARREGRGQVGVSSEASGDSAGEARRTDGWEFPS